MRTQSTNTESIVPNDTIIFNLAHKMYVIRHHRHVVKRVKQDGGDNGVSRGPAFRNDPPHAGPWADPKDA